MQPSAPCKYTLSLLLFLSSASAANALFIPVPTPPTLLDETHPNLPTFTPGELWNIDTKVDDGKPGLGQVVIYGSDSSSVFTNCTDATDGSPASAASAKYLTSVDNKACAAVFRNQF